MISLSIHKDRIVAGQVVNHCRIVYNDIDDLEFDHFPAKTFAKIERRRRRWWQRRTKDENKLFMSKS